MLFFRFCPPPCLTRVIPIFETRVFILLLVCLLPPYKWGLLPLHFVNHGATLLLSSRFCALCFQSEVCQLFFPFPPRGFCLDRDLFCPPPAKQSPASWELVVSCYCLYWRASYLVTAPPRFLPLFWHSSNLLSCYCPNPPFRHLFASNELSLVFSLGFRRKL